MMGYIITGICCFVAGSITSIVCVSLCQASKSQNDSEAPIDVCYGCFGASFCDCERCPKKGTSKGEE